MDSLGGVFQEGKDQFQVRYYDTLQAESQSSRARAGAILGQLASFKDGLSHVLPGRRNWARQGPLQCGFFICWYMEEEVRCWLGEPWGLRGWPSCLEVRDQLLRIVKNIQAEAGKMLKDAVEVGKIEEAKAKAVDAKGKAIEKELSKEAMKGLAEGGAMEWVEGIPVEDDDLHAWAEGMLELMTEGHQELCRKVRETGIGVRSKCRWQSGCTGCDLSLIHI